MKTIFWNIIGGSITYGAGVATILGFVLPIAKDAEYGRGQKEIADELTSLLRAAGIDTKLADLAISRGDEKEAVRLATKAVLAKDVAVAPMVPFLIKENEVIDLPFGGLMSFMVVSIGSTATIRLKIDQSSSEDLDIADAFPIPARPSCKVVYLSSNRTLDQPWEASFRIECPR